MTDLELRNAEILQELLFIRERYFALSSGFLNSFQLHDIIADVATNQPKKSNKFMHNLCLTLFSLIIIDFEVKIW